MARKHRITNVLGLGSLPLIKRDETVQPRLGLKKFTEEYNREQQAAKEAPQRALDAELREEFRLNTELVRAFFGLPMQELDRKSPSDAPCDFTGDYPLGTVDRDGMLAARNSFLSELAGRGVTLSPEGATRFGRYFAVLVERRGVEVSVAAFFQALDRCVELGIFAPGEISGCQPQPKPIPQAATSQQGLESIEHLSTERHADRAEILRITFDGWSKEFAQWFLAWIESLHKNFNYEFPIHELGEKAANFLERHNLSPFVHSSWNKVRVAFVKLGYFPDAMLTPSEKLAGLIEDADLSNRDVRLAFNRTQREINEAAAKQRG